MRRKKGKSGMQDDQMTQDGGERLRDERAMEDEELIWWVRYSLKPELAARSQRPPEQFSAFFYARDEAARDKKIAGWRHYIHHDQIVLDAIEQVTADFKLEFLIGPLPEVPGWAVPAERSRRATKRSALDQAPGFPGKREPWKEPRENE